MKIIRRVFGLATMLAVVLAIFVWFENAVSGPDMTGFYPQEMGRLESAMWPKDTTVLRAAVFRRKSRRDCADPGMPISTDTR